ncbi:hypothetical protein EVAR_86895_1 [Eumeta japonica]|uniref:Uncharacterized protein n=1 Tax=Eumeta variegata TaxID=151549 RepID=A0A4C1W6K2_EUMVA|nr:hypothetical protein EVAR_86895_1 [Eumeta japonica]
MRSVGTTGSHTVYASRGSRGPRLALRSRGPPQWHTSDALAEAPRVSSPNSASTVREETGPDRAPLQPHINVCGPGAYMLVVTSSTGWHSRSFLARLCSTPCPLPTPIETVGMCLFWVLRDLDDVLVRIDLEDVPDTNRGSFC